MTLMPCVCARSTICFNAPIRSSGVTGGATGALARVVWPMSLILSMMKPFDAGLTQDVTVKSRESIHSGAISQHPISRDAFIQDREFGSAGRREDPLRKKAWPASIG